MMKKIIFFVFLVLIVTGVNAQKKKAWNKPFYDSYPYHFGFAFTMGELDFSVKHADNFNTLDSVFSIEGRPGAMFGASMVLNLKLADNWDLRFLPGLLFGQRKLNYIMKKPGNADTNRVSHTMKIETTLLEFPLLVKYRSTRESNYRPYVIMGITPAIDLAARKKIKDDERPKIRLNRPDVYFDIGAGLDNYLMFFKFSTELRFSFGLMDIVSHEQNTDYTEAFKRLGSKKVSLIIYFE
jgi:hypothetical protein